MSVSRLGGGASGDVRPKARGTASSVGAANLVAPSNPSRLSGGSFRERIYGKDRYLSGAGTPSGDSSSSLSSTSSSLATSSTASTSRSSGGLNRIASGAATSFQNYASRYIDSIRPKSWGNRANSTSANSTSSSSQTAQNSPNSLLPPSDGRHSRSAGNSRSESPLGGIPHLLSFKTPTRLSPSHSSPVSNRSDIG